LQGLSVLFASLANQVWGDNTLADDQKTWQCMRNMILEGVNHFHCVHVAKFSLPGYDTVAQFKEAVTSADGVSVTFEVASALLQHFCRVFNTALLLWIPCLDRPIMYCKPALPGLQAPPFLQGYHVAMLGGPGSLRFVSLRPKSSLPVADTAANDTPASAAVARTTPRYRSPVVRLQAALMAPPPNSGAIATITKPLAALVVDTNSLMKYSTFLCSQNKGFTKKPHLFYLKLETLARRKVVRFACQTTWWHILVVPALPMTLLKLADIQITVSNSYSQATVKVHVKPDLCITAYAFKS